MNEAEQRSFVEASQGAGERTGERADGETGERMDESTVDIAAERIGEFLSFLREQGKAGGTVENYRHSLKGLSKYLPGEKRLRRGVLQEWQRALIEKGYAVRTVNARTSAVNRFWNMRGERNCRRRRLRWKERAIRRSCPGRNIFVCWVRRSF